MTQLTFIKPAAFGDQRDHRDAEFSKGAVALRQAQRAFKTALSIEYREAKLEGRLIGPHFENVARLLTQLNVASFDLHLS